MKYLDPDGRCDERKENEKKYFWLHFMGYRIINDNGTGQNLSDDSICDENITYFVEASSTEIDSYDEAYNDAQNEADKVSNKRNGPPITYNYDESNSENDNLELSFNGAIIPVGDGTCNHSYEVHRWYIREK